MILYINRTADILLSDHLEAKDVNVREVIDEFKSQCDAFAETFEAFVLMAPGRVRVTCKSSRKLEAVEHTVFFVFWCAAYRWNLKLFPLLNGLISPDCRMVCQTKKFIKF